MQANQSPEPTWLGASVLRLSVLIRHVTVPTWLSFFVRQLAQFMRILHYITIGAATLAVAFFIGCSKSSSSQTQQSSQDMTKLTPGGTGVYLGIAELSTNTPTHLAIDASKNCTISTTTLSDGKLRLDITVESGGRVLDRTLLDVPPGQQFGFQTRGMTQFVKFTAKLIDK